MSKTENQLFYHVRQFVTSKHTHRAHSTPHTRRTPHLTSFWSTRDFKSKEAHPENTHTPTSSPPTSSPPPHTHITKHTHTHAIRTRTKTCNIHKESKPAVVRAPFDGLEETQNLPNMGNEAAQTSSRPVGENLHTEESLGRPQNHRVGFLPWTEAHCSYTRNIITDFVKKYLRNHGKRAHEEPDHTRLTK